MQGEQRLSFGPYQVDPDGGQLWRNTQAVKLTPKALAVLRLFLARPGQVVTKDELLQAVWAGTAVSDAALTSCIQELRQALRDDARKPRYLETVHRRGFRFIARLTTTQPVQSSKFKVPSSGLFPAPSTHPLAPTVVGREAEIAHLHGWLEKALNGERQIVFVTGEPGIGKTTLVEAFLAQVAGEGTARVGRGQCIEHYGAGEAYLPLLEALGRLCRAPGGKPLIDLLARHAPTWLVQIPALVRAAELEALQRKVAGAPKERMLRELAEALEIVTAERPLVLWLEDLHWSDVSTLDWLAFVARRREQARLSVIGTYRPVDVLVREHPLRGVKQELQVHGHCQELALDFLSEAAVTEYLAVRFGGGAVREPPLQKLARFIHQRTDGNPLFMINLVDHLLSQSVLVQMDGQWTLNREGEAAAAMPESLRQLIEQRLAQVGTAERTVLEVASVAGTEFSAAAVAAGLENTVEVVEEQCAELARRELFLRASSTTDWPDGTVAARYGFLHALYQEVLYERIPAGRRQRVHHRIGERQAMAYGERAREIAAELAVHFERGRDYRRAVQYLQQAGENAIRRNAHQEAISHFTKGLELLKTLPDTPERAQQELTLLHFLRSALIATKGLSAREVESVCSRAWELCQQLDETPQLIWVLRGLCAYHIVRSQIPRAREIAEQVLRIAQGIDDPINLLSTHASLGAALAYGGDFAAAQEHFEQAIALSDQQWDPSLALAQGLDSRVSCLCQSTLALWMLGYPDQALKRSQEALALASKTAHQLSLAQALYFSALFHQLRREPHIVQKQAEKCIALSAEHGFSDWLGYASILKGWAQAEQGQGEKGIGLLQQGLAAQQAAGVGLARPAFLGLLAEMQGKAGKAEAGLLLVDQALTLVEKSEERYYEAELYRLKGELRHVVSPENPTAVEISFRKGIAVARRQRAKSLELRAVMSLCRLFQQQGRNGEAREMLADIYGWFTEGSETIDLKQAKGLLASLS